jgi:hypothetical protein
MELHEWRLVRNNNQVSVVLYIITIGMNAVDNLNFCLGYK